MPVSIKWLIVVIAISVVCIFIAVKMKLPIWKFQVAWILFNDVIAVVLLGFCLNSALY